MGSPDTYPSMSSDEKETSRSGGRVPSSWREDGV